MGAGEWVDHMANQMEEMGAFDHEYDRSEEMATMTRSTSKKAKEKLPTTWCTRDEGEMLIRDMVDSHLENSIAMLQRNAQKIAAGEAMRIYFDLMDEELGDGVFNAFHSGAAELHIISQDPAQAAAWMKNRPQYQALIKERKRRRKARNKGDGNRKEWLLIEASRLLTAAGKVSIPDPEWHAAALVWVSRYRDLGTEHVLDDISVFSDD